MPVLSQILNILAVLIVYGVWVTRYIVITYIIIFELIFKIYMTYIINPG